MIAVNESSAGSMVLLFKTLRGYAGGNIDPVDFISEPTCDEALTTLGYVRTGPWQPVPERNAHYAPVRVADRS